MKNNLSIQKICMIRTTEITDLEMKIRERIIDEISTTSGKQKTYGQIQRRKATSKTLQKLQVRCKA